MSMTQNLLPSRSASTIKSASGGYKSQETRSAPSEMSRSYLSSLVAGITCVQIEIHARVFLIRRFAPAECQMRSGANGRYQDDPGTVPPVVARYLVQGFAPEPDRSRNVGNPEDDGSNTQHGPRLVI